MRTSQPGFAISLAPYLMVRVAGLPYAAVADLACPASHALAQQIGRMAGWISEQAPLLCDHLYQAAKLCEERPALRAALINAKRAVHNGRLPKALDEILPALPAEQQALLQEYCHHLLAIREAEQAGEALLQCEADEASERMQRWAAQTTFQQGLSLASASLSEKLREYLRTSPASQKGRLRKLESSLAMYLSRAATKASPFSHFTYVAQGGWAGGVAGGQAWRTEGGAPRSASIAAVNQALLTRLAAALAEHPAFRPYVTLRINPVLRIESDRYLAYGNLDQSGNSRVAFTAERLVAVPRSPEIDHLLEALQERPCTWAEASQLFGTDHQDEVESLLEVLVQVRILEATWLVPDTQPDYLAVLAQSLAHITDPLASEMCGTLQRLAALSRTYATASAAERLLLQNQVSELLGTAFALVEKEPGVIAPPQLFEDATWAESSLQADQGHWADGLQGLASLERILPLFDRWRQGALAVRDLFISQHGVGGTCDDLLAFLLSAQEAFPFIGGGEIRISSMVPAEIEAIEQLQAAFLDGLRATSAQAIDGEAELDPAWLEGLAAQIPPSLLTFPGGHGYLVQPLPGHGRFVLNEITGGVGRGPARYLYLVDGGQAGEFTALVRSHLHAHLAPGQRYLELPGAFGFNANRRPPLADRTLLYPGVDPACPPEEQVRLDQLRLRHCPSRNRLVLEHRETQEEMIPLNAAALTFPLCPALFRALALLCPVGNVNPPLRSLLEDAAERADGSETLSFPRLRLGGMILQRRAWLVPKAEIPIRPKGATDFAYFLQVERWRAQLGLPDKVFIRTTLDPAGVWFRSILPGDEQPAGDGRDMSRKPQYLDFSSALLVRIFEKHLQTVSDWLLIEEMLPGPEALITDPAGRPIVSEWLVELNHAPLA